MAVANLRPAGLTNPTNPTNPNITGSSYDCDDSFDPKNRRRPAGICMARKRKLSRSWQMKYKHIQERGEVLAWYSERRRCTCEPC